MRYFFFILLLGSIISACETIVEIELPDEPNRIVVNALVKADSSWLMRITSSKRPLDNVLNNYSYTPIQNAQVTITDNEGNSFDLGNIIDKPSFVDCNFENCDNYSYYIHPNLAIAGSAYTLTVNADGYPSVQSKFSIPEKVSIKSAELGTFSSNSPYSSEVSGSIIFQDNPNEKNFYVLEVYSMAQNTIEYFDEEGNLVIEKTQPYYDKTYLSSPDPSVVNIGVDENDEYLLLNDQLINGNEVNLNFTSEYFSGNRLIYLLKHISEDYYEYLLTYESFNNNVDNPFAEPVQVFSNIENGLGIVAAYSIDTVSFRIE